MSSASPLSKGHQITLHALEVLRLIGDRMERRDAVDLDDIRFLFRYFSEVAHPCLGPSATHRHLCKLFGELTGKLDSEAEEFVRLSRVYTNLLADLILLEGVDGGERGASVTHQDGHTLHQLELKYISPHCI